MSSEFGPDFITVTDEDGNDIELEFLDALEHDGVQYMAFFPAQPMGEDGQPQEGDEEEAGIILLKVVEEDGEELLSTLDDDEELEHIYELFMERLFDDEEEDEDD